MPDDFMTEHNDPDAPWEVPASQVTVVGQTCDGLQDGQPTMLSYWCSNNADNFQGVFPFRDNDHCEPFYGLGVDGFRLNAGPGSPGFCGATGNLGDQQGVIFVR